MGARAGIHKIETFRKFAESQIKPANLRTFSQPEAAKLLNVSERTIQRVKAVEREAPELIPEIEKGKIHRRGALAPE